MNVPSELIEEGKAVFDKQLDWGKCKERFDRIRQACLDLDGVPGAYVEYVLWEMKYAARRYNAGERTYELYEEMMSFEE